MAAGCLAWCNGEREIEHTYVQWPLHVRRTPKRHEEEKGPFKRRVSIHDSPAAGALDWTRVVYLAFSPVRAEIRKKAHCRLSASQIFREGVVARLPGCRPRRSAAQGAAAAQS